VRLPRNTLNLYVTEKCHTVTLSSGVWSKRVTDRKFCNTHLCEIHTCAFCGKEFHSKRSHTETCSQKCRTALCRLKKRSNTQSNKQLGLKQSRLEV